jgi:hypothetical protein
MINKYLNKILTIQFSQYNHKNFYLLKNNKNISYQIIK